MNNKNKFSLGDLRSFAVRCYDSIENTESKQDALKQISGTASSVFGDYFGVNILQTIDEISVRFVELLDQIIFEIEENNNVEARIRDYISNDLYDRVIIYLEAYRDIELYRKNLQGRLITEEDLVVISHYRLSDYVPLLMKEYYEQPALQKTILKKLVQFESDDLLNFFYTVAKEKNCIEVIVLALIGLKKNENRFSNWHQLKSEDEDFNNLVDYIKSFNMTSLSDNYLPGGMYTLIAVFFILELNVDTISSQEEISWMIEVLSTLFNIQLDDTNIYTLQLCVSNILIYFDLERLKNILVSDDILKSFIYLIEFLPQELFSRITFKLSLLGEDFLLNMKKILDSDKVKLSKSDSNMMTFLMWETQTVL